MAINIPSLFRDVIETPEQRQRRKLAEQAALIPQARGGFGDLVAPLVQATSLNLQQGSEGLGRSVGGMLGLDMRDTSEKVSDQLLGANLSSPQGMRDLSVALRGIAPLQSIGLIQAAQEKEMQQAALQRELNDREQIRKIREQQIAENERLEQEIEDSREAREENAVRYRALGIPEALVKDYLSKELSAAQMLNESSKRLGARASSVNFPKYTTPSGTKRDNLILAIDDNEEAQRLLDQKINQSSFPIFGFNYGGDQAFSKEDIIAEAALHMNFNESINEKEAINRAVSSLPNGGLLSLISRQNPEVANNLRQTYLGETNFNLGNVNQEALRNSLGLSEGETNETSLNAEDLFSAVVEYQNKAGSEETNPTETTTDNKSFEDREIDFLNTVSGETDRMNRFAMVDEMMKRGREAQQQRQVPSGTNMFAGLTPEETTVEEQPKEQAEFQPTLDDYLKAFEELDFPAISSVAEAARMAPDVYKQIKNITDATLSTISSREALVGKIDSGYKNLLKATGALVNKLVEGQNVNDQNIIDSIDKNIKKMENRLASIVLPPQLDRQLSNGVALYKQLVDAAKAQFQDNN